MRRTSSLLPLLWGLSGVALVLSAAAAITIGPAAISVPDVYAVVVHHLGGPDSGVSQLQDGVVWQLRLPRAVLAAVVSLPMTTGVAIPVDGGRPLGAAKKVHT